MSKPPLDRLAKIQLLKDLEAGRITLDELRDGNRVEIWMTLDGSTHRRVDKTKDPDKQETRTTEQLLTAMGKDMAKGKEWHTVTLIL